MGTRVFAEADVVRPELPIDSTKRVVRIAHASGSASSRADINHHPM